MSKHRCNDGGDAGADAGKHRRGFVGNTREYDRVMRSAAARKWPSSAAEVAENARRAAAGRSGRN